MTGNHGGSRPGAGRPKASHKKRNMSLCMDPRVWTVIDSLRERYGMSRGQLVEETLRRCFKAQIQEVSQ